MGYSQKFRDEKPLVFPQGRRTTVFSSVRQKFWKDSSEITIFNIEEMFERNGLANRIIKLMADKAFNKGWEPDVDDDVVIQELALLNKDKKIRWWLKLKEAFTLSRAYGVSLVLISYIDGGESLEDPVLNPVDITQLTIVDKRQIKKFIYEDETNQSGEIVGVELIGQKLGLSEDIKIHSTRFVMVGDSQSKGMLFHAWNWLELFDNNTWSFGQALFRYGSGFPFLKIKDASETELENAEALWANVTARTGLVGDDRHELEFVGAAGKALDFKAANDVGLQLVSIAMGMPYALVVGAHAGTVAGSETNSAELYDQIEAIQRNELEAYIWEFLEIFNTVGLLSRTDFGIKWIPLWQLDSKEVALIEKTQAETDQIYMNLGITNPNEIRRKREYRHIVPDADFDIDGGDEYKRSEPQPVQFSGPGSNAPGSSERIPNPPNSSSLGADAVQLRQASLSKLEENDTIENMISRFTQLLDGLYDWSALFTVIENLTSLQGADDNQSELLTKIELTIDSNQAKAREAVDKIIEDAYGEGFSNAEQELEKTIGLTSAARAGKSALKASLFEIVKGLNSDVKRELRNTLLDELQKAGGSDLPSVRVALKEKLSQMREEIPNGRIKTIARTETNRAFNEANYQAYQAAGVERVQVITARDDRVRPEHAAVDGEIRAVGEPFSNGYLRPPFGVNCRCSIIPVITPPEESS
jgi:phage-related protein (TIGR01555 family)